jgi:S-adenosylmethionine hydrolase
MVRRRTSTIERQTSKMTAPIITLTTDFGTDDIFVGVMKGVILGINPQVRIVDLTHAIPPQSIELGALLLRLAAPYFLAGTIHVAVVDPGVGTARPAICIETGAGFLVGPDNGLLAPAAEHAGVKRVIACTDSSYWLPPGGPTFHGRDVFAPVAAHLSRGVPPARLGAVQPSMTPLPLPPVEREHPATGLALRGRVIHVDGFGNLFTNITASDIEDFPHQRLSVSIANTVLSGLTASYAAVPEGGLLVLLNSWGLLEIAQRNGSAHQRIGADRGETVTVWATPENPRRTTSS